MSGASRRLEFAVAFFREVLLGLFSWPVSLLIRLLVPRRKDLLVVIGTGGGQLAGNVKYFLLQAASCLPVGGQTVFVTRHVDVVRALESAGFAAVRHPSLSSMQVLLRAGCVVVDSDDWTFGGRRLLLSGARLVQLWHGVGFKRIGLSGHRDPGLPDGVFGSAFVCRLRQWLLTLRMRDSRNYDLVAVTSAFYRDEVFRPAFRGKHYLLSGYPRNTFGRGVAGQAEKLVWETVDAGLRQKLPDWQRAGRRLILVSPTFRDTRGTPMGLDSRQIALLDDWCEKQGCELLFKFHPLERDTQTVAGQHLHLCAKDSDIYPLLPFTVALVTDYSSIYMDYLLLDKPVLFFVPDMNEYLARDRQIQFDYEEMTPGPKSSTWPELLMQLETQLTRDEFAERRKSMCRMAFDDLPQEEATRKIVDFMIEQGWIG